ncbi:unnamed protein product [Calypogeia fissa]
MATGDVTKITFSESDKLVGASNYMIWSFMVEQILREKDLWEIIERTTPIASSTRTSSSTNTVATTTAATVAAAASVPLPISTQDKDRQLKEMRGANSNAFSVDGSVNEPEFEHSYSDEKSSSSVQAMLIEFDQASHNNSWIMDSRATSHISSNRNHFSNLSGNSQIPHVQTASGSKMPTHGSSYQRIAYMTKKEMITRAPELPYIREIPLSILDEILDLFDDEELSTASEPTTTTLPNVVTASQAPDKIIHSPDTPPSSPLIHASEPMFPHQVTLPSPPTTPTVPDELLVAAPRQVRRARAKELTRTREASRRITSIPKN